MAWGLLHGCEFHLIMGRSRMMVQGDDTQCSNVPATYVRAYIHAHRPDDKTHSSSPKTRHWFHTIAHGAQSRLRTTTSPQQRHAEATISPLEGKRATQERKREGKGVLYWRLRWKPKQSCAKVPQANAIDVTVQAICERQDDADLCTFPPCPWRPHPYRLHCSYVFLVNAWTLNNAIYLRNLW